MNVEQLSRKSFSKIQPPPQRMWPRFLATGIFMMLLGLAAIFLPFIATMTIEALLAAIFIIAGVIHIVHGLQVRHARGMAWRLLTGGLYALVGILLVSYPLHGAMTLTVVLAALFMFSGVFKVAQSLHVRPGPGWGWLFFNGILSLLLGIVIWTGLPGTARWAVGLLVGIELLFTGWVMIIFSMTLRQPDKSMED